MTGPGSKPGHTHSTQVFPNNKGGWQARRQLPTFYLLLGPPALFFIENHFFLGGNIPYDGSGLLVRCCVAEAFIVLLCQPFGDRNSSGTHFLLTYWN